jgi:hypothetical protein
VVEPTAEGLAGGIEQYYTRHAWLPEMVERAYGRVEKLRWLHMLKDYETLYEEALGD